MKKIIALILAVCCLFAVVSCSGNAAEKAAQEQIEIITPMFDTLVPTKSVTTTSLTFGVTTLNTVATLTTGTIDGADAAVLETLNETLADVKGGGSLISKSSEYLWYVEGLGTCANKSGNWDAEGKSFAPTPGSIKLNLNADYLASKAYDAESQTLTVTVAAENVAKVLGNYAAESTVKDVMTIKIVTAGGRIASIELEYVIPEHTITYIPDTDRPDETDTMDVGETKVVVKAEYTYDYQQLSMS